MNTLNPTNEIYNNAYTTTTFSIKSTLKQFMPNNVDGSPPFPHGYRVKVIFLLNKILFCWIWISFIFVLRGDTHTWLVYNIIFVSMSLHPIIKYILNISLSLSWLYKCHFSYFYIYLFYQITNFCWIFGNFTVVFPLFSVGCSTWKILFSLFCFLGLLSFFLIFPVFSSSWVCQLLRSSIFKHGWANGQVGKILPPWFNYI